MQASRLAVAAAILVSAACAPLAVSAQMQIEPTHPNGEVSLVVDLEVKPGFESEFETAFRRSVRCTRLEPGAIMFDVHKVVGADGRYVLYEIFRSPAALRAHFEQPYTRALFAMFDRALVRPVTEGGLRFVADLAPAQRHPAATTDSSSMPDCR